MYIILRGLKDNLKIKFLILLKTYWIVCYVEDVYPCVQKHSFPFNFDKENFLVEILFSCIESNTLVHVVIGLTFQKVI